MPLQRLRSLDFLRGIMLVIMTVDHLDLYGPIYRFTFETFGFASAAEGFVLLSGLVAGIVYAGYAERGELAGRVRSRLWLLWRYHAVVVLVLLASRWWRPELRPAGGMSEAATGAVGGLLLLNQEPPLDILPLYLLLVALLPLALMGFHRGYAPLVLAASAGVWLADQWLSLRQGYPSTIAFAVGEWPVRWSPNHFHLAAWQFLFVAGAWCGWRWRGGDRRLVRPRGAGPLLLALAAACVLALLRHGILLPELPTTHLVVGRTNLGWLRLADVALLAWLLAQIDARWPRLLQGRWFERLGRHALAVFAWQTVVQIVVAPVYAGAADAAGLPGRLVVLVGVLASLAVPAWWRERRRRGPRTRGA